MLIKLRSRDGNAVVVNTDRIISVSRFRGYTIVTLDNKSEVEVYDSPEQIHQQSIPECLCKRT